MVITWLRWLFFGKNLTEILANFEKTQSALDRFHTRTDQRMQRKQAKVDRLGTQIATHVEHMGKAKLVGDNLRVLLNEQIGSKGEGEAKAA